MSASITFYDIASSLPDQAWSPNTWRIRYALNIKGIPYQTVWVEYPDIEDLCKRIGAAATSTKIDGRPHYTLPVIHDHSTGAVISDGPLIAEYLDTTYPSTPKLYSMDTLALQHSFLDAYLTTIMPLFQFALPTVFKILNPASQAYYRSTREKRFGKKLEDVIPTGEERIVQWKKVKDAYGTVDGWLKKSGGPFVMGDTISFADITIVSFVLWVKKIFGEDSAEWQDISSWHGGRWEGVVKTFEKYQREDC